MFHRRCRDIEALLRGQIGDLSNEVDRLRNKLEVLQESSYQRERELLDQLMVLINPQAFRVAQSARSPEPARPRPVIPVQRNARGGTHRRPGPVEMGYRPAMSAAGASSRSAAFVDASLMGGAGGPFQHVPPSLVPDEEPDTDADAARDYEPEHNSDRDS